jgi:hypothetical protein
MNTAYASGLDLSSSLDVTDSSQRARHWVPSQSPEKVAAAQEEKRPLRQRVGLQSPEMSRQGEISSGSEGATLRLTRAFLDVKVNVDVEVPLNWD